MTAKHQKMRLTPELVARVAGLVDDPGPIQPGLVYRSEADHEAVVRDILAAAPATGDVWIFGYGSLIWKPAFEFVEQQIGLARGWHRSFCLGWDTHFRGSPNRPGLMMTLDHGGGCKGIAYRLLPQS